MGRAPAGETRRDVESGPPVFERIASLPGETMGERSEGKRGGLWVVAHRGYSAAWPENTLLAFEKAIEAGADMIEADLRLSRDGVLVCSHDSDLARVAGRPEPISGLALSELRKVRFPAGGEGGIATLEEVIGLARGRVPMLFDLKLEGPEYHEKILAAVRAEGLESEVVLGVRSLAQLAAVRRLGAVRTLGFLKNSDEFPAFFAGGGTIARLFEHELTPEAAEAVRGSGKPLWVTAGRKDLGEKAGEIDEERIRRIMRMGIDGLLLNDPALAVRLRGR